MGKCICSVDLSKGPDYDWVTGSENLHNAALLRCFRLAVVSIYQKCPKKGKNNEKSVIGSLAAKAH